MRTSIDDVERVSRLPEQEQMDALRTLVASDVSRDSDGYFYALRALVHGHFHFDVNIDKGMEYLEELISSECSEASAFAIECAISAVGMFSSIDPARAIETVTRVGNRFERWPPQHKKRYLALTKKLQASR